MAGGIGWSCKAALKAAVAAKQSGGYLQVAWAVCPRVCGGSCDAIFVENAVSDSLCGAKKMEGDRSSFVALCAHLCVFHALL